MERSELILKEPKILKGMIILSLPVLVSNILRSLHDVVDTFFLNMLPDSSAAIGAVGTTWAMLATFLAISVGLSVAGISIISQYVGAKKVQDASLYASKLLGLAVGFGILLNIIIYFGAPLFMTWMGAKDIVHTYGTQYLTIRSFEMIYLFVFSIFASMRQAIGDTKSPVIITVISLVLNIILTPIFVFTLNMNVIGAALATLIANVITLPIVLYMIFNKKAELHVEVKDLVYNHSMTKKIIKVAIPVTAGNALSSFGFVILQAMILGFGIETAAAFSVGNRISSFFLMPGSSLGSVLSSYIGQNMGAGNTKRAIQSYRISRNATLIIMSASSVVALPFVRPLASLLSSGETLRLASEYLIFLFLTQPFMALYNSYCGVFDGSGNTRLSFLMHTIRLWVFRIPVVLILHEFTNLGSSAIWICMLLSNFLISILGYFLMKRIDFTKNLVQSEG